MELCITIDFHLVGPNEASNCNHNGWKTAALRVAALSGYK